MLCVSLPKYLKSLSIGGQAAARKAKKVSRMSRTIFELRLIVVLCTQMSESQGDLHYIYQQELLSAFHEELRKLVPCAGRSVLRSRECILWDSE